MEAGAACAGAAAGAGGAGIGGAAYEACGANCCGPCCDGACCTTPTSPPKWWSCDWVIAADKMSGNQRLVDQLLTR